MSNTEKMQEILYGAAYYDEYMPYDRLDQDIQMLQKAGMNVVRIGESTWATYEPQPGVFDFNHLTRVIDRMQEAGIKVIVGTPTYAVPSWLVKLDPMVIADTMTGTRPFYGWRQIMDITNGTYRFYAERIIRKMMQTVAKYPAVIGYQIDNETKYYGAAGRNIQSLFIKHLRKKFHDDLDALNKAYGLNYWSNRINAWEDFPDVRGTINGSLSAEFDRFRRTLVDEFLQWQADIVSEYRREDQFITQNFAPNETYQEASRIGNELKAIGSHLVNLKKHNQVAILVSNEALTALDKFRMDASVAGDFGRAGYNDVLRWIYDTFYHMNVECDFISTEATLTDMAQYPVLIVPALYTASDALLSALKQYVSNGGELVTTFKTGFANEDVKVASDVQPHILQEVIGAHYHEFTLPRNVGLKAEALELPSQEEMDALPKVMKHQPAGSAIPDSANLLQAELFMELLIPDNGQVLYSYDHPFWGKYAAVVEGEYGKGHAIYIGCKTSEPVLRKIMEHALKEADVERTSGLAYPIVVRQGTNDAGKTVTYFLNYSRETQAFTYPLADGTVLLTTDIQESNRTDDQTIHMGDAITLAPWGVEIVEFWLPPLRQLPSLPLSSMYR